MKTLLLALTLLMAPIVCAQEAERKSADGVPYPAASEERWLDVEAPLIGKRLGGLPEEMHRHVFSRDKAADIARGIDLNLDPLVHYAWFCPGIMGADLVGFNLDRETGRVEKIFLYWKRMSDPMAKRIESAMASLIKGGNTRFDSPRQQRWKQSLDDGSNIWVTLSPPVAVTQNSRSVSYQISYIDLYLLKHKDTPPEIAQAIRLGNIIVGMTIDQANAAAGRIGEVIRSDGEVQVYRWSINPMMPGPTRYVPREFHGFWMAAVVDGKVVEISRMDR